METKTNVGEDADKADVLAVAVKDYPAWEIVERNWPTFRGPGANGVAHYTNAPTDWDVASGKGIRWKVPVPRSGTNSPVVWGSRLFMSGADESAREIYCYDTETGELLWTRALENFPNSPSEAPLINDETGYAAPTMAVHGEQVFAIFANGDLVSYDFDGNQVWGFGLGLPENHYGHSSSLLAYNGLLYVQFDTSESGKLLALDIATGKEIWTEQRKYISWASPILAHTNVGPQLILNSSENVDAYDPLSGKLLWTHACMLGCEVGASPAYSDGLVFAGNDLAVGSAIKLGGTPEAVESEIIWEWDEYLPEASSPVGDGERFYLATGIGDLVAIDAKTGEEVWAEEVDYGFYSSMILVGDRFYVLDREGVMYIVRASAEYELIATRPMGEATDATPAFMDGRIYIRTAENLYCIE